MLNIKCFPDGDRLVVVLEGIDIPAAEEMVKGFFSSLVTGASIVQEEPAYAAPIPVYEEECPPVPAFFFEEEPYAGKTPEDILLSGTAEEISAAFKWLRSKIVAGEYSLAIGEISSALDQFLKNRFEKCVPDEYCKKLTDVQLSSFLTQHNPVLKEDLKKNVAALCNVSDWDSLLISGTEDIQRLAVCEIVKNIKNLE